MKILIYHPSKQHIYKLLEGLSQNNIPYVFYTGLYHGCKIPFLLKPISSYLKRHRSSKNIPVNTVQCITPWHEFLFSLWAKTGLFLRTRNKALFEKQRSFQHKLLHTANFDDITHVITFHTNAFYLYPALKEKNFRGHLIIEATQPHPRWIMQIYEEYIKYSKYFPLNYTPKMVRFYASEFEYADVIIAPSTFVKKTITKFGISESKILTILHGTDFKANISKRKYRSSNSDRNLKIAYTGIISYSKGIHFLLKVAEKTKHFSEFHLFGNPINRSILKNLPSNVIYHGYVDHRTLLDFYGEMDIFYFPTLYDASGLALLEAVGAGLIPIASYNSIAPDIIMDNETGFLINPEDTEYASDLLHKLYKNRDLFNHILERIRKHKNPPSWQDYQEGYIRLLKTINL